MSKSKLWQTGSGLHPLVESYTVGQDYKFDQILLPFDLKASQAHVQMLLEMQVISEKEADQAKQGLQEILKLWEAGKFQILPEQEDGHTAIEQYLTEHFGEVGQKIHTGRSRNDQSLVMIRLYMKDQLTQIQKKLAHLVKAFQKRRSTLPASHQNPNQPLPMPGYTHTQKAMPTTVDAWLESYEVAYLDQEPLLQSAYNLIDQNPLGSASGFGIQNFPLQREITTQELGFQKTQDNPLYCGLSRGLFESMVLQSLAGLMIISSRLASDLILFTTQEFNFFSLPDSFVTGSSIMPQKKNYDVLEIMRAQSRVFMSHLRQVQDIIISLGSGYHRDLQLTKGPLIQTLSICQQTLDLLVELLSALEVNVKNLEKAMTKDLYVTAQVYELVKKGHSFRQSYQEVKKNWQDQ